MKKEIVPSDPVGDALHILAVIAERICDGGIPHLTNLVTPYKLLGGGA
jgi:hypothetical protein